MLSILTFIHPCNIGFHIFKMSRVLLNPCKVVLGGSILGIDERSDGSYRSDDGGYCGDQSQPETPHGNHMVVHRGVVPLLTPAKSRLLGRWQYVPIPVIAANNATKLVS